MPLPRMGLDRYLAQKRLFVGSNAIELRAAVPGASTFGAMLSIKEYPPFSGPGLLDGLLTQPHEFILTQSFALHDRAAALEKMNRTGRQVSGSDDAGTSVADDVDAARDKLASAKPSSATITFRCSRSPPLPTRSPAPSPILARSSRA